MSCRKVAAADVGVTAKVAVSVSDRGDRESCGRAG